MLTHYLTIFLHLDVYLSNLIQQFGNWTYVILFLIFFCESGIILTPFLPGDSLLFALGSLAARGTFNLPILLSTLIIAAIFGGILNYYLGLFIGNKIMAKTKNNFIKKYIAQTQEFFGKYGNKTILIGRLLPIIRTYAPFVAGIGRMRAQAFMLFNLIGAVLWIGLFVGGSYYFGNLPAVRENFSFVILAIICISVVPAIIEFLRARYRNSAN